MRHEPVLINETIEALRLKQGDNVIDCTMGDGGHSEAILEKITPEGHLLGLDADPESLLRAKRYLYRFENQVVFVRENFANLEKIAKENSFFPVQAVLMDLGWSSSQFEERGRGFSFSAESANEKLDMRYNSLDDSTPTAADIVNQYDKEELTRIFHLYGEEERAMEIATAIIAARKINKIETAGELTEIILTIYRNILGTDREVPWVGGIHPATKVFQALRMAVNREIEVLKQALPQAFGLLAPGGRLAVITFHSIEDRVVKQFMNSLGNEALVITKKPIAAGEIETDKNHRARCAKLRVVEKANLN